MKSLRFQKLYLCSEIEKSAKIVTFDQKTTVVLGENDTGKSCLLKSIYAAFGADAFRVSPSWESLKVDLLLEFTIDEQAYRVLRTGSFFALFDGNGQKIWEGSGIVGGIAPVLANLLDFRLTLQDRSGNQVVPPPAYCFLPFYVDQDIGWIKTWSSFSSLHMFEGYKHDVSYFHAGLLPNEYFVAKGAKLEAERTKNELKTEQRALERATTRLRTRDRKTIRFDLDPASFGEQISALLRECEELQLQQDAVQRTLSELSSKRVMLLEQKELASNALVELDADYEFLRDESEPEIVCPTCGTIHTNDFSNKFGLVSDAESCRRLLLEVQHEIDIVDEQISTQRASFGSFGDKMGRINALLDEQRGELRLRDLIEGESERLVDTALDSERKDLEARIREQEARSDEAVHTMKSFEGRKFQKPIKDRYFAYMKSFVTQLKVPNLPEKSYKRIDCSIKETGSDLPRALLAYYLAFIHTMRSSDSPLCPLIIDTPVQQDQDSVNAARMIEACLTGAPAGTQVILGTVGLHGVAYEGHTIRTETKYRLLSRNDYDEVAVHLKPHFAQILQRK
ncbi:hypothetical protein [Bradyrhizobium sp. WSM2793]|uniref:hypothetical protein n=1 Tax=Bradyrhizobium sp. WSM2793 TaxID=1038866 RepID=UPI00037B0539|nr:hypothetical protein [Bradyrhizobium sp. WSM2793]